MSDQSETPISHLIVRAWKGWLFELNWRDKMSVLPVWLFFTLIVAPIRWGEKVVSR